MMIMIMLNELEERSKVNELLLLSIGQSVVNISDWLLIDW